MDKGAIKKYAVWARRELISRVSQRAALYDITESGYGDPEADSVRGKVLTGAEKRQRRALIRQIGQKGYEEVMEEVAYTWFNRFCALRFMEVNGYLPTHVRVFTDDENEFKPQILAEAINMELDGLDMERVYTLKNGNENEELFKYLIIIQCNALNKILPGMFQRIEDYTELLFPDNLLREGSAAEQMISLIPEEDWKDQVQIIGWLYQYYNSEKKDEVFAALKKNVKITKENIPAATQLFTPDWIVRYMVENSLGRLWVEGHPNEELKGKWRYYLEEAKQEPEVERQLEGIRREYGVLNPEDLRCIDPCMGSGHILCYMFDVLMQIYQAHGVQTRDAVKSIVENNLFGLDIDDRAAQLAYFSVMMKGRQYDSRFFRRGAQPNVYSPKGYEEGREYGALLTVERLEDMPQEPEEFSLFDENYEDKVNRWRFRAVLARKYHVVCTNPPYMAVSNSSRKLQEYIKKNFPDSKSDLFACFIEHCGRFVGKNGFQAMITQHAWMFLSVFEGLRKTIQKLTIINMAHLGSRAFEEIGGEVVQTTSFVFRNVNCPQYKGIYVRLLTANSQEAKERMYLIKEKRYIAKQIEFSQIPGIPVAYWANNIIVDSFKNNSSIRDVARPRLGFATGDNDTFMRLWFEPSIRNIGFAYKSREEAKESGLKWFPTNKGGCYRKWYGNIELIVDWQDDGYRIRNFKDAKGKLRSRPQNLKECFSDGITWTVICNRSSFRYSPLGMLYNNKGPILGKRQSEKNYYILGYLNSNVSEYILQMLSPTLGFEAGYVSNLPYINYIEKNTKIKDLVKKCIAISKKDWDCFEISWDFKKHSLL